jgi:hypothetical protein
MTNITNKKVTESNIPYYISNGKTNQLRINLLFTFMCFNEELSKEACPVTYSGGLAPGGLFKYEIISNLENHENFNQYKDLQLKEIIEDDIIKGSIISAIIGITQDEKTNVINIVNDEHYNDHNYEDILIDYIINNQNEKKYNAIIDVGGIILKYKPRDFINKIFSVLTNYIILYVLDGTRYIYNENQEQDRKYNNEIYENVFIFYDNKNCVGIDFKQPYKMHGLVIINNNNNITDTSQGIFRLRNINIGHTIDIFNCTNKVMNIIDIYLLLKENDINYKNSLINNAKIQCLKFIKRKRNNNIESFKELIYYDTIRYDELFYDLQKFNKQFLFSDIDYIDFDYDNLLTLNTHIQVETEKVTNTKLVIQQNNRLDFGLIRRNITETIKTYKNCILEL